MGDELQPVDYMLAVMRNEDMPVEVRLEAAGKAAPYVHKKQPTDIAVTGSAAPVAVEILFPTLRRPDGESANPAG